MRDETGKDGFPSTHSRSTVFLLLGAFLLVSAILRFFRIGNQSLWVDEMLTLAHSAIGQPWSEIHLLQNIHGPLQSVLMHVMSLFGHGESIFRVPSAVFGTLTTLGMFWIGRQIAGPRMGLAASYFCAISPLAVWYSQEARNYSMCLFFTVLALGAFLLFVRSGRIRHLSTYGVSIALALLSNLSAAFVALGAQMISLFGGSGKRVFWKVAVIHVIVAVLFTPWIIQAWSEWIEPRFETVAGAIPLRGETTFTPMAVPFALYTFSVGFTLGPSLSELHVERSLRSLAEYWHEIVLTVIAFGLLSLRGVAYLFSQKRRDFWMLAVWFATPIVLVSLLGILNIKPFNPRYALVAWPAYLLFLSAGVLGLRRNLMVFAVGAVTALSFASLANHYFSEKYWKEDTRSAAEYLRERTDPDSKILSYSIITPLRWYLPEREIAQIHPVETTSDERVIRMLSEETKGVSEFWLVTGRDWASDPSRRVRRLVEDRFVQDELRMFSGVEVSKHSIVEE
jgi:4-amino-4-deoxy-L-arabinose transferase-like glycosyltransferase